MKFALAAAVLAETLPSVLSSTSSNHEFSKVIMAAEPVGEAKLQSFLSGRKSTIRLNGQQKHSTGDKLKVINRRRILSNGDAALRECNPAHEGADTGILSCGSGRYCLESGASTLGGYCATVEISRKLQENNNTLIENLFEICYGENAFAGCTCEGVNVQQYVGSISCVYSPECITVPNACAENQTFCYSQTYDLTVTAEYSGSAKQCYNFESPKVMSYCYSLTIPADGSGDFCEIEVDGTKCNSCASIEQLYEGEYATCTQFDCSNTNIATAATYCDYNIPTLQVQSTLLYDSLPCDRGCNICGEGSYVRMPYNNFTLLNNETYSCGLVELAALAGYFEGTQLCTELNEGLDSACECSALPEAEPPFTCNICGSDNMIVSNRQAMLEIPNQEGPVTCEQLGTEGFLTNEECPVIQSLVQQPCGCVSNLPTQPEPEINEINNDSGASVISALGVSAAAALLSTVFSA
jgi:hypothetical protein